MSAFDLDELRRLLADATPGPWHDTYEHYVSDELAGPDGKSLLHARSNSDDPEPCFRHTPDAQLVIAMRNAMPALLAEAEAGRQREAEVAEFLRAGVPPVPVGDGKEMVFRAPSLKMAMQMLTTERDIAVEAIRRSRDEYADLAHRFERAAYAGRKLREACEQEDTHMGDVPHRIMSAMREYDAAVGVK